jgi:hypothetical protein
VTWIPLAAVLAFTVFGWSRLCFGAWTARTTTLTPSEEDCHE